jgi:hypothetical protein
MVKTLILVITLVLTCSCAFADGPWKGTILDIETKEPLEGAVVLAFWNRIYRTPFGTSSYFYEAKETITNKVGEFEIPSYTTINLLPIISYMQGPEFIIFKPGYGCLRMALGDYLTIAKKKPQEFELSGRKYRLAEGIIELPQLRTIEERRKNISYPASIPNTKMQRLIEIMNSEAVFLGLEPTHMHGRSK